MSGAVARSFRPRRAAARVAAASAALATSLAFAQPAWVLDAEGVYPDRHQGASGVAYVEAARFPAGIAQAETGLFVVCDAVASDAYDLFLWAGPMPVGAVDAAGTVEVLTRRGDDAARSARWSVEPDPVGQVLVANAAVRALLLDDLRLGGSLAVRVLTDPAAGAAQPTFVYEVDGFPEADLDCAARAAAANDPFAGAPIVPVEPADDDPFADAPVVPVDPFADAPAPADPFADAPAAPDPFADAPAAPADPFADAPAAPDPFAAPTGPADPFADAPATPADPFADAPAAPSDPFADAPPAPGDSFEDDFLTDPTTGLLSLFGTLDEFAPLPARVDLVDLIAEPERALLYVNADRFSAIGGFCNPEGGGDNGFLIEFASPAFEGYGDSATLVLYVDGAEVGYAELGVYRDNGTSAGYVAYDADELGILRAFAAFPTLEAVLSGDGVERAEAYWSFATLDLATAIDGLACAPAF